ncbi:38876_t:CDS:1, partial [Gigaspora margarita]
MSLESSGTLNNEETLLHMIKKYNTNELIEYLQNKDPKLDNDDFTIICKEKIAGLDFFDLIKEEFQSIGLLLGPATRLVKLITEIKKLKVSPHELRQQNHDLKQL